MKRSMLEELIQALREYPSWKDINIHLKIVDMVKTWLSILTTENPEKLDGYLNFMFTYWLKSTHQTFHMIGRKKKYTNSSSLKEAANFIREILYLLFERDGPSYFYYERIYGLLSCMELEFERRGWSLGRKDLKEWFKAEKRHWAKKMAVYEDEAIIRNGDI